jgi:hypothetical protein
MERYRNLGGNSGIYAYELGEDYIKVQFSDGSTYLYTNRSAGSYNIEIMKSLAIRGQGLNSFISTTIKRRYESRIR